MSDGTCDLADIARRNAGEPTLIAYRDGSWNVLGELDLAYEVSALEEVVFSAPLRLLPTFRVVTDWHVAKGALAILAADEDDLLSAEGYPEEQAEKLALACLTAVLACDSGRLPEGEDPSGAECEASQSGPKGIAQPPHPQSQDKPNAL